MEGEGGDGGGVEGEGVMEGVRRGSLRELKGRGRKCQSVYVGGGGRSN